MLDKLLTYKDSEYLKKTRKMLEAQWDKKEEIDATIDLIREKERVDFRESNLQKIKSVVEMFLWLAMLFVAISTRNIQKDLWDFSNLIQLQNTNLNQVLTKNSNDQLSLAKTQTTFQVLDTLNKSLYIKDYDPIKDSLKNKTEVKDKKMLQEYLNNFENIYIACHRWLIAKSDVRYSYQYLLGMICWNDEAIKVVNNWYGWLKKLCWVFFPDSKLAKNAKMDTNEFK